MKKVVPTYKEVNTDETQIEESAKIDGKRVRTILRNNKKTDR